MSKLLNPEEMTSRDYYFDSYAHFGIHEVNREELVAEQGSSALLFLHCPLRQPNVFICLLS